jgi:cytochrome P450
MNLSDTKTLPGPSVPAALRALIRTDFLTYIGEMWRTYGDIFQLRMGTQSLIVAVHPEAVRYTAVTNRKNYEKLASYDVVRQFLTGNGLLTSGGDLWRRQRKLMSPFFTPRGVQAYAEIMLRDGMRLVERWERLAGSGQLVDMGEEMTLVTAQIILRAMFSTEADESIIAMKDDVETMISFTNGRRAGLPLPLWLPTPTNRKYSAARARVHSTINELIAQRRALPEDQWPQDLLARLMLTRDEETGASMAEDLLRDESITLFFAGHETTARTLGAAWYALDNCPPAAQKLRAELDAVLGDRYPTVEDLHRLPYTLQVIKEVLRLYPPAPFYVRDAVADDSLDGYPIPAGSAVLLSPFYTHRHPNFWEDPLRFDPDRWSEEREAARHPYAYHPFAAGQRICIGNNFSLLEAHILLALLAQRFAPKLEPGHQPRFEMRGVLVPAGGLPMRIQPRK